MIFVWSWSWSWSWSWRKCIFTMILEKCDMVSTVCPKEMCTNILGTNRKAVHEALILMLCKCIGNLNIFSKQFPFPLNMKVGNHFWKIISIYFESNVAAPVFFFFLNYYHFWCYFFVVELFRKEEFEILANC